MFGGWRAVLWEFALAADIGAALVCAAALVQADRLPTAIPKTLEGMVWLEYFAILPACVLLRQSELPRHERWSMGRGIVRDIAVSAIFLTGGVVLSVEIGGRPQVIFFGAQLLSRFRHVLLGTAPQRRHAVGYWGFAAIYLFGCYLFVAVLSKPWGWIKPFAGELLLWPGRGLDDMTAGALAVGVFYYAGMALIPTSVKLSFAKFTPRRSRLDRSDLSEELAD